MKKSTGMDKSSLWCRGAGAFALSCWLAGCASLPTPPVHTDWYDLGAGPSVSSPAGAATSHAAVALAPVESLGLPEGSTLMVYRLAYAGGQQLRPYAQARWMQPPQVLVQQRLREQLGMHRAVLLAGDGVMATAAPGMLAVAPAPAPVVAAPSPQPLRREAYAFAVGGGLATGSPTAQASSPAVPAFLVVGPAKSVVVLRIELEAFQQVFSSPTQSTGVVRWRATALQPGADGDRLLGQKVFVAQQPAATADAAGGAQALAQATDQAARDVDVWLGTVAP